MTWERFIPNVHHNARVRCRQSGRGKAMGGGMRDRGSCQPEVQAVLVWGLIACMSILGALAVSQPIATDLPKSLNLSGYPPGTMPPEFTGATPEGGTVSLADLRGRVVLLNFWASWCLECRPEMPAFERLHLDFGVQGFTVLGVNVREGTPAIKRYAEELGLTFPLVLDPNAAITVSYGVIGLPSTFLIGRDGRAVARAIGPRDWGGTAARAFIQALLAEPVVYKAAP